MSIPKNRPARAGLILASAAVASVLASLVLATASVTVGGELDTLALVAIGVTLSVMFALTVWWFGRRGRGDGSAFWNSRDFLAAVVENTADGIIAIDQNGTVRMFNPAAERMFGYEPSEILGKNVSILLEPEDREVHDQYVKNSNLYQPKIIGAQRTLQARRKDGVAVPVEISISSMRSESGPLFIGVCHDIGPRRQAEEALRVSEERLQDAIESIREGFVMYDSDDRLLLCNSRYRELYDVIADVLVPGLEFSEQLRIGAERGQFPQAEGRVDEWIAERLRQHRSLGGQIERLLPNGRWVKIEERRTRSGNIVGVRTDITQLKARERQLRESEERYRHLVDLLPDGVMVHADGIIVFANDAMARILGMQNRNDLIGRTEIDFIPPEERDDVLQRRREASISKTTSAREAVYLRADGSRVEVERARAVISWEDKTAFLMLAHDITARKRAEKAIIEAKYEAENANHVKSAFLANMSHELRTPLNAIIGFSDLMKREAFGPLGRSQYRDYSDHIFSAGEHLLALINDILDLSKVEAGSEELQEELIEVVDLVQAVMTLVKERAYKGGVRIDLALEDDLPMLRADLRKMRQILVNILSNAVKFTEAGGSVTVEAQLNAQGGHMFRITDTGLGIAPEDISKALTPFGQITNAPDRSFEGTGLGLPLTKKLVELHDGRFGLQSELGVGTTITIEFPKDRTATPDQEAGAGPHSFNPRSG